MTKKITLGIFIAIVIFVIYELGFGIHRSYLTDVRSDQAGHILDNVDTSEKDFAESVAHFNFEKEKLAQDTLWYIGRYYKPLCIPFGCEAKYSIWIPLHRGEHYYPNECSLSYFDIAEQEARIDAMYNKKVSKFSDPYGKGYKYDLSCISGIEVESKNGVGSDKGYYHWGFEKLFDPTDDIARSYPDTLGILLKHGHTLPTRENRVVKLNGGIK
jgi:hypothetical protein